MKTASGKGGWRGELKGGEGYLRGPFCIGCTGGGFDSRPSRLHRQQQQQPETERGMSVAGLRA